MERKASKPAQAAKFITFKPGNGTVYEVVLVHGAEDQSVVLCWLNPPTGLHGRCGSFMRYMAPVHYSYFMNVMDCSPADAAVLMVLLHEETGYGVLLPPSHNDAGLYSGGEVSTQLSSKYPFLYTK